MSWVGRAWGWVQRAVFGRSDVYFGGSLYMRRWRVGVRWLPGLRLHHTLRGDLDAEPHDHPFWFVSLILAGGYTEHRPGLPARFYGPGSVVVRSATDLHRLSMDRPTWSLVLRGPVCRIWGFMTAAGWVPWYVFVEARTPTAVEGEPGRFAASSSIRGPRR